VCDTSKAYIDDYYDYEEEESFDNCSLASPLYIPLRRSETHYKRFRNDVMRSSNRAAERLMDRMKDDREFGFRSSFRFPLENEFYYKRAIASGFEYYSTYTELFHSYISWGDFPKAEEDIGQSYRRYSSRFNPVSSIARAEFRLDEAVSNLSEDRNRNRHQNMMKQVVRLMKPDTWPYLASCLYEAFKENKDSSTLSRVITDLVSDEDFEKFNIYFKRYVGDFSKSLKKVLESEDTIEMVQLIYELTKSEIKSIDYNSLQPTLDYFVLQLKTVLMKPDFNELYTTLNQTDYFIQESQWKAKTLRWPDMVTMADNTLRRTFGSIVFWDRLTGQFIPEMKNEISDIMDELKDYLVHNNVDMEDVADTIFVKLTSIMFMVADGDDESIRQLFQDIRRSKWDETVTSYIEIVGEELTSCNLATLASYLPSYDEIKSTLMNNHFFQPIKTLWFNNWPQDEIYPASLEDYQRGIYDARFPIFIAVFGNRPCDDDNLDPPKI